MAPISGLVLPGAKRPTLGGPPVRNHRCEVIVVGPRGWVRVNGGHSSRQSILPDNPLIACWPFVLFTYNFAAAWARLKGSDVWPQVCHHTVLSKHALFDVQVHTLPRHARVQAIPQKVERYLQTCIHTYIHTYIHTDLQTYIQTDRETYIQTDIHTQKVERRKLCHRALFSSSTRPLFL